MKRIIRWIKNNWRDPVWSKVFAWAIVAVLTLILSGIWILIQHFLRQISFQNSILEFVRLIRLRIPVPLWIILLLLITTFVFILLKYLKRKKYHNKQPTEELIKSKGTAHNFQRVDYKNIGLAKPGYNSSLDSKFLGSKSGIFSIWGYVSDIHNKIYPHNRNMYIVGYATNNGNPLRNPKLAHYPNAWAILRSVPTVTDNNGVWRFWCNNINKEVLYLDYNEPLTGWHLFSVAWSSEDNYIKFVIDNKVVSEQKYINWPSDFSGSVMIGTWANRSDVHFFDSQIGPYRFIETKYKADLIEDYFNKKPELTGS